MEGPHWLLSKRYRMAISMIVSSIFCVFDEIRHLQSITCVHPIHRQSTRTLVIFASTISHPFFKIVPLHPSPPPSTPAGATSHIGTWPHLLVICVHPIIYSLCISWHDQAVWHIHKMLMTTVGTQCLNLVNATRHLTRPPQQTILPWLYPFFYTTKHCQCHAWKRPDIILLQNYEMYDSPPFFSTPHAIVHVIEFAVLS